MNEIEEIGALNLDEDQIIKISKAAESAARKIIFKKIPKRAILDLNIIIEVIKENYLTFNIDINLTLSPFYKINLDEVIREAVDEAFKTIRRKIKELVGDADANGRKIKGFH